MVCFFEKAFRLRDTSLTSLTLKSHCRNDTPIVPAHRKTEINWLAGCFKYKNTLSCLSHWLLLYRDRKLIKGDILSDITDT